jgi:starch synthase (maltosyl-transferring)
MPTSPVPPLIYNLFPRLVGPLDDWVAHGQRVRAMSFNWLFLNPIQYPGFSGSLYAIKDFYRLNPAFAPRSERDEIEALRRAIAGLHDAGLRVMLDLVVNHTSKDSPPIKSHPDWFRRDRDGYVVSPSAIDPADARKVTVWGDLAEVDNAGSQDRASLWAYWTAMVQYYLDLGFDGFRCDAAYKVPARLWQQLIGAAHEKKHDVLFCAETLGCRLAEVRALSECGFDYLYNSSKWWAFDQTWALDQHAEFSEIAPAIAFPESHDTERLFRESGGRLQVQRQRYAFAAAFSQGLMMPIGYERCLEKKLDVVKSTPDDWADGAHDISGFIGAVNGLKLAHPTLSSEGSWRVITDLGSPTTLLAKSSDAGPPVLVAVNKDGDHEQTLVLPELAPLFSASAPGGSAPRDESPGGAATLARLGDSDARYEAASSGQSLQLQPAEVAFVLAGDLR